VSAFIEEHRERFGVEPICVTLGVSASAYYQRATGQRSVRAVEDERLLSVITELHAANYYAYGSRRVWKALIRAREQVGRSRVERLMRQNGLQGAKRRGKPWRTTKSDPRAHRPPDLVKREFVASRPDEKWFADFTYLRCWEGLVFFSFVIDTPTAGGSSAGSLPATCAPTSCSTRCGWRSISASPAPMSAWSITATPEVKADSSGRRNTRSKRGCDGQKGSGLGACRSTAYAFAGSSAGVAQGASAAVLGGDCAWPHQRGGRC
jgi:HTH-like domain